MEKIPLAFARSLTLKYFLLIPAYYWLIWGKSVQKRIARLSNCGNILLWAGSEAFCREGGEDQFGDYLSESFSRPEGEKWSFLKHTIKCSLPECVMQNPLNFKKRIMSSKVPRGDWVQCISGLLKNEMQVLGRRKQLHFFFFLNNMK